VGNREALLAGAKRCLLEKGYARATVRDITAASGGVSMAAIGYHFGSREALLTEALIQALDEWGAEIQRALAAAAEPAATASEQFEAVWTRIIESFTTHRPLWVASLEAALQAERSPELRRQLAAGQHEGRRGTVTWLQALDEDAVTDASVRTVGSVHMALISGVMMQWLIDPQHSPSGHDVVQGLRAIAAAVEPAIDQDA